MEFIPEPDEGPDNNNNNNNSSHPVANPSGGPSLLNTSPRPSLDSDGPVPSNSSEEGARQEGIDGYRTSFVLSSNSSRASAPGIHRSGVVPLARRGSISDAPRQPHLRELLLIHRPERQTKPAHAANIAQQPHHHLCKYSFIIAPR